MNYPKPVPSTSNLSSLIEALTIICKYNNPNFPTRCEHDVLFVQGPAPTEMEPKDAERLVELGFVYPKEDSGYEYEGGWITFRFGSC